jgi:hypothetical protein
MFTDKLSKLKIIPLKENITESTGTVKLDEGDAVEAIFNPETIEMSKSVKYTHRRRQGKSNPATLFSGGNAGSMTLKLFFDSTDKGEPVTDAYRKLFKFLEVKPSTNKDKKGEPRQVQIVWGSFLSYVCVIESISQTFTYFLPDGTPLRADVSLSLCEAFDQSEMTGQNPTSRTDARETWVVEKGQRIEWIAHQAYGKTSAWRHLAETNNLLNPAILRPGQILKIIPLP